MENSLNSKYSQSKLRIGNLRNVPEIGSNRKFDELGIMESLYENMKCAPPKIGYPRNLTSVKFEKFELQPEKSSENFNTRHPNLNKLDRENPT